MTYPRLKRAFDVICSGIGLVVLLPFGLLIALLIKLSDGGSVFYGQTRIGQFGRPFRIWKFRSMVPNADTMGVLLTHDRDPRITWIGRFLRRSKLDELPQLWNVLIGDMSLVGPRPEVPRYVERYTPEQREILNFKPGITDVATMHFRNEETLLRGADDVEEFYLRYCLSKKIELNRQYEARATLLQDLWIIIQTLCPYWLGALLVYTFALTASFWLSCELRADFQMTRDGYGEFFRYLPWVVLPQLTLLFWRGQLRGLISYFSIPEMWRTATALAVAALLQFGLCFFSQGRLNPAASLLLTDFFLSVFALCGVRFAFRLLREHAARKEFGYREYAWRVAIIGTGELATTLALDLARNPDAGRTVVAFFDDNPRTWHKRPHDIPVVGMPECLLSVEWANKIDEVIVALPGEDPARLEQISTMLKDLDLKVTFASGWPLLAESK